MLRMKSYRLAVCLMMGTFMAMVQAEEEKSADIRPNPETLRSLEKEINAARGNSGLSKLVVVAELSQKAQEHANWMQENGLVHSNMGYPEIIARGQKTPEGAVNAWLGSRGHRGIMLGGYARYGVGCIVLNDRDYWIAIFE